MIKGKFKVAVVILNDDYNKKEYGFACFDADVVIGDKVVCNPINKYTIGKVVNIISQEEYAMQLDKEIICKINDEAYKQRVADREIQLAKEKELKKIEQQLNARMRTTKDIEYYSRMAIEFATIDPEIANMAKRYVDIATGKVTLGDK